MANLKVTCLRKGVVVGRISQALNELYVQVDIANEADMEISHGALQEIKSSLGPLKRNFRTSPEEVRIIDAGVKKVSKLLRGNPTIETIGFARAELREIRANFRKAVQTGFSECGAGKPAPNEIGWLMDDNSLWSDTHPDKSFR